MSLRVAGGCIRLQPCSAECSLQERSRLQPAGLVTSTRVRADRHGSAPGATFGAGYSSRPGACARGRRQATRASLTPDSPLKVPLIDCGIQVLIPSGVCKPQERQGRTGRRPRPRGRRTTGVLLARRRTCSDGRPVRSRVVRSGSESGAGCDARSRREAEASQTGLLRCRFFDPGPFARS